MVKIIHIGYPKAASSFIQENFFKKHPRIQYLNVEYPSEGFEWIYNKPQSEFSLDAIKNKLESESLKYIDPERKTIIADERFTFNLVNPFMVAERLYNLFPGLKILIIIRNQPNIIRSLYDMHPFDFFSNNKRWISFDNWLDTQIKNLESGFLFALFYDKVISKYIELFGANNVGVFMFEEITICKENVINYFSEFMELEYSEVIGYISEPVKNKADIHYLYHIKMKLLPNFSLSKVIPKNLLNFLMKKFSFKIHTDLTSESMRKIKNLYRESNKNLQAILNTNLPAAYLF